MTLLFLTSLLSQANTVNPVLQHHLYLGVLGGYGSTTWDGLVPTRKNQNMAMQMSTPVKVVEGGATWGFLAGYEFTPYFALEANYTHYRDATVSFSASSLFSFDHNGESDLNTQTEAFSVMGKVMLIIPDTALRFYSSAGVANLHREDFIINDWRFSPTFGIGLNYSFTNHFMGELAGDYTAGFGESQLNPADTYFPFLYSVSLRLAYSF